MRARVRVGDVHRLQVQGFLTGPARHIFVCVSYCILCILYRRNTRLHIIYIYIYMHTSCIIFYIELELQDFDKVQCSISSSTVVVFKASRKPARFMCWGLLVKGLPDTLLGLWPSHAAALMHQGSPVGTL